MIPTINAQTPVIVQGITGREGSFHTHEMLSYGTHIVGGVTPGKGGEWAHGKPIFDTLRTAIDATGATASVIFVPPESATDAVFEAVDNGIQFIVCVTEGVPVRDMLRLKAYLRHREPRLLGPNSPGVLVPGQTKIGIIPGYVGTPGNIGVVSRSGTLMYEITHLLSQGGFGQSMCIGIGGDPVIGVNYVDALEMFENDPDTEKIVLIGEIGGNKEIKAAEFIAGMTKPVIAYVTGYHAPSGVRMGHIGAICTDVESSAQYKMQALRSVGARVVGSIDEILPALAE